jgi:hypothetical protein
MSYIGNTLTTQGFSPAIDYFSGTGSQTAFTLSRPVASVAQVQVVVNNVTQNPSTAYTVSGNTITFTGAPSIGTNNIYVSYTSPITQVQGLTQSPSVIGPMYVGINGATPLGGATNPIVGMSGSANNYVQSYIQNLTNGANSSADFTAYPSNGTDAAGWVDMGITGPSFSQSLYSVTGPNEAYLFGSGPTATTGTGNLVIATDSTGTANAIQFYTNGFTQAKSAAAMTIDKNQNVGIGISSPLGKLDARGDVYAGANARILITENGTGDAVIGGRSGTNYLGLTVNGAEKARIDSSGNLLVGTTAGANNARITVQANSDSFSNVGLSIAYSSTVFRQLYLTNTGTVLQFTNGSNQASLSAAGAWTNASDARLKKNIVEIKYGLTTVLNTQPRSFERNDVSGEYIGFIAQELKPIIPEVVFGSDEKDDQYTVDYASMVAIAFKAIQEQQAIITQLQADVAALKTKAGA